MCACFDWKLGLISSSIQVPKWVSHVLNKCVLEEFWRTKSQTHNRLNSLDIFSIYRR